MRLGLLADVHEDLECLHLAWEHFRREEVDQVVLLGDVVCTGKHLEAVVGLLQAMHPVGVWGNHDFGLCQAPSSALRQRYSSTVVSFFAGLRPRLEIDGCLFTHVEPWLDPTDLVQLWYFEGAPDTAEKIHRSFDACPQRLLFSGHLHRWLIGTQRGPLSWDGGEAITLSPPERYLVVLAALCRGWCAVLDTQTSRLEPCRLREDEIEEPGPRPEEEQA